MFGLFKKKISPAGFLSNLKTDLHSHLIPGIDDGVKTLEESTQIAMGFQDLGYQRIITTPHIYPGVYNNNTENILSGLELVKEAYKKNGLDIEIQAAAEYYVDEIFLNQIKEGKPLLTFGKNLILIETGFMEPSLAFDEVVFLLKSQGLNPVFAHPERYVYIHKNPAIAESYLEKGMIFQLNFLSLSGYYADKVRDTALDFLKKGYYGLIGSDCHKPNQFEALTKPLPSKTMDLLENSFFSNSGISE